MNKFSTGKRILIFLGLAFVITYLYEIFVIANVVGKPEYASVSTLLISTVMFIPAICVVLTRLITKEGFKDAWILPNFKGHLRYYVLAWLLPVVLIAAGAVLYFLIYPDKFDPNMGYMAQMYAAQGLKFEPEAIKAMMTLQIATSVLLAPVLNILTTTGEEWGWRGYLVPKLSEKLSIVPTVLISGVIWGLWHAPLTVLGHNYGLNYPGYPYTGILAMCVFCIVTGAFFSYVSLRTRSCLPAAIGHGALNGFAGIGIYFTPGPESVDTFLGPAPTGLIGGAGFIIVMVVLTVIMVRLEKKNTLIAPPKQSKAEAAETAA
jgi:membrane protease YdiL (CAAX protease family)